MAWTTKEASEFLDLKVAYVGSLCKKGLLKATKHGRDWDIDPDSVRAYRALPKNKGGRPRKTTNSV
jgi:hypothetical protein